jgi:nucleoside-diphosphate-sugar epimerase
MSVLLTGGSGFIGLNLAEVLLAAGERVVIFAPGPLPAGAVTAFAPHASLLTVETGDIRDGARLRDTMRRHRVDRVIHGAAVTAAIAREQTDARGIVEVNLIGTIELLEACVALQVRRIVQLGTGAIYGSAVKAEGALDEVEDLPAPDSLYGISKYAAERTGLRYRATRGLDLVVARLGVSFGRWEYDTGVRDTLSVPLRLVQLAEAREAARLAPGLPDDWVYATDVADAVCGLLRAARLPDPVYHVASGHSWDAQDWCRHLAAAFPGFEHHPVASREEANVGRVAPAPRPRFSIRRLQAAIGYLPRFDAAAACADFLAWRGAMAGDPVFGARG